MPVVVVRDPSAERGAARRRTDHCHAINSEGHTPHAGGERVGKDSLLARLQPASIESLQDPEENQESKSRRQTTKKRACGKERHAAHVKPLAADETRNPGA